MQIKMKKLFIKVICLFIPSKNLRKKIRNKKPISIKESALAHKYLDGLNGVEIGASTQNSFGLEKTPGAYANIDFEADQGQKWQANSFEVTKVNFVASGDNLPFKDNSLDYIISSHVIEHFFDPIAALEEWYRVIKDNGYIFIIVPHKERTFDKNKKTTTLKELILRHNKDIKIQSYVHMTDKEKERSLFVTQGASSSDEPHLLIENNTSIPNGWERFKKDDHHHWSIWTTEEFLKLCKYMNLNIVEYQDVDDKVGNGFTVVIKK